MVSCLIPDALEPLKPHVTKAIRNFAKQLDGWLTAAFEGVEAPTPELLEAKRKGKRSTPQFRVCLCCAACTRAYQAPVRACRFRWQIALGLRLAYMALSPVSALSLALYPQ